MPFVLLFQHICCSYALSTTNELKVQVRSLETLFDPNLGQSIHLDLCRRKLDSLKLSIVQLDNGLVLRLETHNAHPMH
jgi:hypothetical protein